MLLRRQKKKRNNNKSLSHMVRFFPFLAFHDQASKKRAKAPQYAHLGASFTVEAAFVLPLFLFAAAVVIGLFPALVLQTQVNSGLQYAARMMAVSWQDADEENSILSLAEGKILFRRYMKEHGCEQAALSKGINGISLIRSDVSGDYVTLVADYKVDLPVKFWNTKSLPIQQCVRVKKWTGADPEDSENGDGEYVYITPSGRAYHRSSECSYLKLSVRGVPQVAVRALRNKDGGIYYPCSCYHGQLRVYVTDYGTDYHGDLNCSGLKRTIYKVRKDQAGDRHACSKCF